MSNGRLIAAIEKRDSSEIYKALREEKADPNSRKQISLKVKIGNNWTTDTIWAESALSLAVIYGRLDYVRALINAGADVEAPVEWRIPNYEESWTSEHSKWLLQYHFDSIVEVAVGAGTVQTRYRNVEAQFGKELTENGRFALNKDGGTVTIINPSSLKESLDFGKMTPDLAIVKLLLAHGAQPTTAAIARVRAIHNAPVLAVLEARKAELESTSRADALAEKLIEAVEKRRLDLLRSALAAGADPNARKRITLTVSVPGFGTRSETVFGESALVLAVLYAQDALVQELLDAGANVHAEVEWRVPNWESEWTMALWNRTRWILHYRCDSLLDLALGSPVLASPFRNVEDDYTILGEARGKLALNKDGGHVHIRTPSSQSEAHDTGNFVPTVGVVRLLLDWGAQITAGAREAAISLRERTYALLVEEALAKSSARRLHGLSAPRRPDSGAAEKKRTFEARLVEETGKLTEFLEEEKFAKDLRAAQLASLQQQLQEAKGQRDTWRAAKAAEEAQTQPDPYQRYTNPNPNPYPNPNPNPNNDIQERLLALEREKAALLAQVGGATVNGPPPVSSVLDRTVDIPRPAQPLETMMVAMSDFYPRDSDELALRYGDGVFVSVGFADGWASGFNTNSNKSGIFPMSHVMKPSAELSANRVPPPTSARWDSRFRMPAQNSNNYATVSLGGSHTWGPF